MNADSTEFDNLTAALRRYGRASDETGVRRMRDAAVAMRDRLVGMMAETVTGADPGGLVQATVQLSGGVASVYISPQAMRLDSASLGNACLVAVRKARETAGAVLAERMQQLSGARPGDPVNLDAHFAELRRLTEG